MVGLTFCQNQIFNWNGAPFKIIRVQPNGDILLENSVNQALSIEPREKLLIEYKAGNISAKVGRTLQKKDVPVFSRPLDELGERERLEVKRRRFYLDKIAAYGQPIFSKDYLQPLISAVAEDLVDLSPPSPTTVYRWYRKLKECDDTRALIPRNDLRGPKKCRQDGIIFKFASAAIDEAFAISPQANISNIYTRLIGKIEMENSKNPLAEPIVAPSERTLRRLCQRMERYEIIRLKEGKASADRRFRLIQHSVKTTRILERVEVDHTPLDLFIVDEQTWLPLGRPTLTVFIDHYSRMLLGYYLTFTGPSTAAVMGALRHAVLPKALENSKIANLPIHHNWPCYGLPEVLIMDNGLEFHSHDLESVAFDLGVRLQYCPAHQPRFKGCVERYLKTINYSFANQLPGASLARFHLRGDYDPQKCALLTFGEFKHLFEKWVVDVYAQTLHNGLGTTPWDRWRQGVSEHPLGLPDDIRNLQCRIGQVKTCKLQANGITVNNINYVGTELNSLLLAYGPSTAIRVIFDPEDLGEIQVWGPDAQEPVTVAARDPCYAKGLTLQQHQFIRQLLREQGAAAENREATQRARYELASAIEQLMVNRKLTARKRSAVLRGMTSHQPEGSGRPVDPRDLVSENTWDAIPGKTHKQAAAQEPPPLLPTFKLPG